MYNAIITEIKTSEHPNADRLAVGYCHGFTVVISKDIQDGQKGVFFPMDGQLSDEFCQANDLYPRFDTEGNRVGGGFIDRKNRRVKGQNFRGVKSEGFWVPISYFSYLKMTESEFKVGETFTTLKGKEVCNKYINPATLRAIERAKKKGKKVKRNYKETPMFPMVEDTKQLRYYIGTIPYGAKVYITEKLHGTSGRTAYATPPLADLDWWQKIRQSITSLFRRGDTDKYKILTGSRRVIKDAYGGQGFYRSDDFRYEASKLVAPFLRKGESIFYEIVGFADEQPIMPTVDNTKVGDKAFTKKFGKETAWTYGCVPGQFKIFIYDWKISNEDGSVQYSYPFEYIQARCEASGGVLQQVPLLNTFTLVENGTDSDELYGLTTRDALRNVVEHETQDRFTTISNHLREGVCVRIEHKGKVVSTYKNKATSFGILEGYIKSEDTVDMEELESYQ